MAGSGVGTSASVVLSVAVLCSSSPSFGPLRVAAGIARPPPAAPLVAARVAAQDAVVLVGFILLLSLRRDGTAFFSAAMN